MDKYFFAVKDVIDSVATIIYKDRQLWGLSNQSTYVAYCITMGSGVVRMDRPGLDYIEDMHQHDLQTFNEKMDAIESVCRAGDRDATKITEHSQYYVVVDQYLAQSVKYMGSPVRSTSDISMDIKNKKNIEKNWTIISDFLKTVIKKRDRYKNQIDKIYKILPYKIIDYTFTIDPKKISM